MAHLWQSKMSHIEGCKGESDDLESAFGWFSGVPQELLFDQMRAVVLSDGRAGGGELVLNAEFLRFAAH